MRYEKEYDLRQLKLMENTINAFRKEEIPLSKLVNDLESLLNMLNLSAENWKDRFLISWGCLEDIYSFMLYENRDKYDEDDEQAINKSLVEIEKLISAYKRNIEIE